MISPKSHNKQEQQLVPGQMYKNAEYNVYDVLANR